MRPGMAEVSAYEHQSGRGWHYCRKAGCGLELNRTLHEYECYIVGRMGIPYRERGIKIISVAVDAPQDIINALSGKLGRIDGISAKAAYSNCVFHAPRD